MKDATNRRKPRVPPEVAGPDGLVGLGMAGEGSHAPGETADLKSLDVQAKRAALLMSRLAKEPRPKAR